jgi:predicted RNase H-like HicB family nuclease
MHCHFTLEYWPDGPWYVGRLPEVPGVFSQGKTLKELQENIQEAYELMVTQERPDPPVAGSSIDSVVAGDEPKLGYGR